LPFTRCFSYRGGVPDSSALANTTYEEDIFKSRAVSIIESHNTSIPLFLFYSFHLMHSPLQVPPQYLKRIDELVAAAGAPPFDARNRRTYAAMVLYLDEAVGELAQAFRRRHMWKDTLMIFVTDNGGPLYEPGAANNFPLRGGKYNDFQGGVATNTFVSGGWLPLRARGSTFHGVVSIADWYAILCGLAGVSSEDEKAAEVGASCQCHILYSENADHALGLLASNARVDLSLPFL